MKIKYDTTHGSPYDRGSADAYYGRQKDPHWYPYGSYNGRRVNQEEMTATQIAEYNNGFDNEDDRKGW